MQGAEDPDELDALLDAYSAQAAVERRAAARGTTARAPRSMARERAEGLGKQLDVSNKGAQLLARMGFVPGDGLGRNGTGRAEPLPLDLKPGRAGLGVDEQRRREREAAAVQEEAERAKRARHAADTQHRFQSSVRSGYSVRQTERHLRSAWKVAQELEERRGGEGGSQTGGGGGGSDEAGPSAVEAVIVPGRAGEQGLAGDVGDRGGDGGDRAGRDGGGDARGGGGGGGGGGSRASGDGGGGAGPPLLADLLPQLPAVQAMLEAERAEEEERRRRAGLLERGTGGGGDGGAAGDEERQQAQQQQPRALAPPLSLDEQLLLLLQYLREAHRYCLFCGYAYDSAEELATGCPGLTEEEH